VPLTSRVAETIVLLKILRTVMPLMAGDDMFSSIELDSPGVTVVSAGLRNSIKYTAIPTKMRTASRTNVVRVLIVGYSANQLLVTQSAQLH
jgi:hypothetical protein